MSLSSTFGFFFLLLGIASNELILSAFFKLDMSADGSIVRGIMGLLSTYFLLCSYLSFKNRARAINILLLSFSIFFTFLLADISLSHFPPAQYSGEKNLVEFGNGAWGHCYPYVPDSRLPLHMLDPHNGRDAVCVTYDNILRVQGFYPERRDRCLLVGDSFTFGEGVPDHDTLGFLLGKKFKRYNFVNFGKPGADVAFIPEAMETALKVYPDIRNIVYFYNLNDALMDEKIAKDQKSIVDFQNIRWFNADLSVSPVSRFLAKSTIIRLIERMEMMQRESALTVQNYNDMYDTAKNARKLSETFSIIESMNNRAKQVGATFTVVIYPLLYRTRAGEYPFKSIHHMLKTNCTKLGIPCIDGLGAFDSVKNIRSLIVHPLDYHPNGIANQLMTDYLVDHNYLK